MYNFQNVFWMLVLVMCLGRVVPKRSKTNTTLPRKTKGSARKITDYCALVCPAENTTKPVCGSDNKDYLSHCHLKKESCIKKNNATLQNRGSCDCPDSCSKDYKPVCASNEKTYHNHCQLKKAACRSKVKKIISFVKKGPCKPWTGSKCPDACTDIWAPVCAVDSKTYSSVCSMKLASCKSTQRIGLKKIGYCKRDQCPDHCPENHRPQCANDGKVYENECEMRLAACRMKKMTELKRASKKKLCQNKCVYRCPPHDRKVCGSNSVTYANECELHRQNCNRKKKLYILKKEACNHAKHMEVLPRIVVGIAPMKAPTLL